jgi:hypothetical protein
MLPGGQCRIKATRISEFVRLGQWKEMDNDSQKQAMDWLRDWSKWLITINFAAAAGCSFVVKGDVAGLSLVLLASAISAFACSALCAATLVGAAPRIVERLAPNKDHHERRSVLEQKVLGRMSLKCIARLQLGLLAFGGVCFIGWVIAKAIASSTVAAADLRVITSASNVKLNGRPPMVRKTFDATVEVTLDVSFVNAGSLPVTIDDVRVITEAVPPDQSVRSELRTVDTESPRWTSASWGAAPTVLAPSGTVRRRVEFPPIEVTLPPNKNYVSEVDVLVTAEYSILDEHSRRWRLAEPVLLLHDTFNAPVKARFERVTRLLGRVNQ